MCFPLSGRDPRGPAFPAILAFSGWGVAFFVRRNPHDEPYIKRSEHEDSNQPSRVGIVKTFSQKLTDPRRAVQAGEGTTAGGLRMIECTGND